MPRVKASLADPSGLGFWGKLLAICLLVVINSIAVSVLYYVFEGSGVRWLAEPRVGQPMLFLSPLVLLSLELWLGSVFSRRAKP